MLRESQVCFTVKGRSLELALEGKFLVSLNGSGLLVHELAAELEDDLGSLLGEKETLAELATVVLVGEQGLHLAKGLGSIQSQVEVGHLGLARTFVHVLEHHLHGLGHVDVSLDLGAGSDDVALVVIELLLAGQEEPSLGALHELSVESVGGGGDGNRSNGTLHFTNNLSRVNLKL